MTEVDIHAPGVEVRKSACYFCHQNCGVLAYVKDGDVIKIEGDPEYTNAGGLCCRGNIALKHLHHPARINHALKRVGEKGENKWEKIPWDQAISEIAERLNKIREESGAEAVATAGGTLRTEDWSRRRFMNLFGSPNSFHNALLCWIPTFMIETAISGWSPFETDLASSKCLVLWGMNPGASSMPGMKGYTDLMMSGLKIIVIDPRYSETASKADIWLPLRPGSDTALSLAMLNTIIYEGLYDQEFVQNWCVGWDELVEHMAQYTPEWAAPLTWLDPEQIREAARMYAKNTPSNIQWGCTWDQIGANGGAGTQARALMRAITGNLDRPGGDTMPGPSFGYVTDEEIEANDRLPEEQKAKQIGSNKYKLTSWPGYQIIADTAKATWGKAPTAEWMCEAHGPSVFKAILTGDPYQVRALIVSATNPVNSYGDSKMTLAALKKVEFMVTCDYWMTPAALYSDYVMPIANALERPTIHTNYGVTDSILCSERAIQPLYDRHTDFTFWRDLGLATGQSEEDWPWKTEEEVFYYIISPLGYPVENYDQFVETYRMYFPPQRFYKYGDAGFCTPSRRCELKSSILERLGYPALPTYTPSPESAVENPELAKEYPITLTTGGGFMPFHHSEQFNIKSLRYLYPDPYFTINPKLADKLGIEQGDWCWIETQRGRIRQRADIESLCDPRVVFVPRGWWFPERGVDDPEAPFGCLESNTNVLTCVDDNYCDPLGGSWMNRGLLCKVYKCTELDMKLRQDTSWSIPGNAKEPGIHEMPSDAKLAFDPIPYDPKPTFEVPDGLVWDKNRLKAVQPETGFVYDPDSGWLIDEATSVYYDLVTGYAYDPTQGNLVDVNTGKHYDMETRQEIVSGEGEE
ncbi:MAG: molybdopterin-dependent oxidoreductase [Eggerthellaceae bacterium]|jgi:anaerobic selenocysteine-containing dehydrogenase